MSTETESLYAALERIFHEPRRLAIMSALLGAPQGLTFNQLKESCHLTDGNLSRHLQALQEAGAVEIKKCFVGNRPRTTALMSEHGRESFARYLAALEAVLAEAAGKLKSTAQPRLAPLGAKLADC